MSLEIKGLTVEYTGEQPNHVLNHINLKLQPGEVLCLVGESGCGKTTLGLAVMGLLPKTASIESESSIYFENQDMLKISNDELRRIRGKKIAMIFQDPMTSLNPVESIESHMREMMKDHGFEIDDSAIFYAIESVGINKERIRSYPHQLSGGMRQRVMIALALLLNPSIIIADEPTTSLDVLVEAQILDTFNGLRKRRNLSMIFITHNFGVVAQIADRVAVMYAGEIVEVADVLQIFDKPLHPYTEGLMRSVPDLDKIDRRIVPLPGSAPSLLRIENACSFRERCPYAFKKCFDEKPPLKQTADGRLVACHIR